MGEILINVHESYRWVVAICDKDVFGKKLVDGKRVLDISGEFFAGKKFELSEAKDEIVRCANEDATFNFVGEKSVELAKELGLVRGGGVVDIDGVPFALVLM